MSEMRRKYEQAFQEAFNRKPTMTDQQKAVLEGAREAAKNFTESKSNAEEMLESGKDIFMKVNGLYEGKDPYSCLIASVQLVTLSIGMLTDVEPDKNPAEGEMLKNCSSELLMLSGRLIADILQKTKNPKKLMDFIKMSVNRLSSKESAADVLREFEEAAKKFKKE